MSFYEWSYFKIYKKKPTKEKIVQNANFWKKTLKIPFGDTVQTIHPPMKEITVSQGNTEILASTLKKISSEWSDESKVLAKDIKNILAQNNYTNIILQFMCS